MSATSTFAPSPSYLKLIRTFPLRPLRNPHEHAMAKSVLEQLAARKAKLDAGERDYREALNIFVAMYDREAMRNSKTTPAERLHAMMQQKGTTPRDLEKIFRSSRALVSLVLHGHRELSKANIRALAKHFNVSTDNFL